MAQPIPCIHFTSVSSWEELGRSPLLWSAATSPPPPGRNLSGLFQASRSTHLNSLYGWGMTSSLLAHRGKMEPQPLVSMHSCTDASALQLLLSFQHPLAWLGRARRKEEREKWEWRAELAAWGAEVRQRGPGAERAVAVPALPRLLLSSQSFPSAPARIFVFPGLADKAASPLIRRPGEWDQRKAGVLQS